MAALTSTNPTLLDLAKRTDPDGKIATIVEILNETNEILTDMSWMEGNLPTGHRTTVRTGLPTATWRKLYGFVAPSKSTTAQITDNTGMLEAYAEVDKALADLNGNTAEFRLQENRAFLESMNQTMAHTLFYGNEATTPEAFTGLSPRYNSLSAVNGTNIINASGSEDRASIWLVVWSNSTVHGIVPKNSKAGFQMEDKGVMTISDATGLSPGRMEAYVTHYRWDAGLTLKDWRYVVRIANIDKGDLTREYVDGEFVTGVNLPDLMFQAMRKVPNLNSGRPVFYMSRDMATWVARQKAAMGQWSYVTDASVVGTQGWTENFQGIPIRRVDVLSADESAVS